MSDPQTIALLQDIHNNLGWIIGLLVILIFTR